MHTSKTLDIDLDTFGFVQREKSSDGKTLINQCGRDFFYYCLNFYFPEKFNPSMLNPKKIKERGIFGWSEIPVWLIWTGLSFKKVPTLFKKLGLSLSINNKKVTSYFQFILGLLPLRSKKHYDAAIKEIENAVDRNVAVGIDIALKLGGLVDHVMFVYGYDEENFYVFDTHQVDGLEYEKATPEDDERYIMKLPRGTVKKRWTMFNRVWVVENIILC